MITQRNASANAHVYAVGDSVKISTRVLHPRDKGKGKMQPHFIGPFVVSKLLGSKTLSVELPDGYDVNNAFNFEDLRPWFDHDAHTLDPEYPAVEPHPSLNPVLSVVNRRRLPGRLPAGVDIMDIPCEYQVLRKNGDVEWISYSSFQLVDSDVAKQKVVQFELRYPRSETRPCSPVSDYSDDDGYESPDEYPIAEHSELEQCLFSRNI